jgi:ABC-type uncharacterized transport system ATPase subunit
VVILSSTQYFKTFTMKNFILIAASSAFLVSGIISACSSHKTAAMQVAGKSVADAGRVFKNAKADLALAKQDSTATYGKFRKESIHKLSNNITALNNYRTTCAEDAVCERTADSLTNRNNELIVKLDNSKADKNWKKQKLRSKK